ncbi:MAG: hypothetical protein CSB24_01920 [Deltaproteobacteria bacterium]|nr:MAG: hypothetical protein CSB24_01920 [Deltaproteobacteria bacterium]
MIDNTAVDRARIVYYGLFASAFAFRFGKQEFEILKNAVRTLNEAPIDEPSAEALAGMQDFIGQHGFQGVRDESDQVFYSPVTSHLPMTASFYYENRDDGSQRVAMIDYLLKSPFRKNSGSFQENEDHIEFILLFIQHLIEDSLKEKPESASLAGEVFADILNGMIDLFADNVFRHEKSVFYRHTAALFHSFADIERQVFGLDRPQNIAVKDMMRQDLRKEKLPPRQMQTRNFEEFDSI